MSQHILITGGCGFIGTHLANRLHNDGHKITVIDIKPERPDALHKNINIIQADIVQDNTFSNIFQEVDFCFHLAAIASVGHYHDDWTRCHAVNSGGFVNLLNKITKAEKTIPVVYASSAAVYGDNDIDYVDETITPAPISCYGHDKLSCEHHAKMTWKTYKTPSIGLRFFNVYGPGQDPSSDYSGVISKFMNHLQNKKNISIFGDGSQTRDFIYVQDVVDALILAKDKLLNKDISCDVFNICRGEKISIVDLATLLKNLMVADVTITHLKKKTDDIQNSCGNANKAKSILNFCSDTDLKLGLSQTLNILK